MKRTSLIAAGAIILIANAFALIHGWRNRSGTPEAEVTLTSRELAYLTRVPSDDDSGVTLLLLRPDAPYQIDREGLSKLGFDCSLDPGSPDAPRFYQRQKSRQVFVALEYDGAAWQAWRANNPGNYGRDPSHLIAIDADRDAAALRSRHPDRTTALIVPGVVAIWLDSFDPKRPARIWGRIEQIPSEVHVPRPFSDGFRNLKRDAPYLVHLSYGASFEPWVTGVEFPDRR